MHIHTHTQPTIEENAKLATAAIAAFIANKRREYNKIAAVKVRIGHQQHQQKQDHKINEISFPCGEFASGGWHALGCTLQVYCLGARIPHSCLR